MITVRYFASLREALGVDSEVLDEVPATVGDVRRLLEQRHADEWQKVPGHQRLLVALNQEMADDAAELKSGDEVAFFPPVTGG